MKEVVIGKIYAEWCGHCKNMGDGFKEVGELVLKKSGGSGGTDTKAPIELVEIEEKQMPQKIPELNQRFFGGAEKLKASGFPTLFMITSDGKEANKKSKIEYYHGGTAFADPVEGEENKRQFQNWIESNIVSRSGRRGRQRRGGGCGCGAAQQRQQNGGWRWSTKRKSKTAASKKTRRSSTKKSSRRSSFSRYI